MRRYSEYKKVDLPWLGEIPIHWNFVRNKNVFTEKSEVVGQNSLDYVLLSLTKQGIIPRDMEGGGKFPQSFDSYKKVTPNQIVLCLFDIDETPRTVGISEYYGMITGAYTIMDVHEVNAKYVYYYYLALDNVKALRPLYTGLRKTINIGTFLSSKLPIPPKEEQNQIANYLDWKINEIDRLIEFKKKHIEDMFLLKEKLIDEILDFKDEQRVKLKRIFDFGKGLNITKDNLGDEGIKTINYGDIHGKYLFQVSSMDFGLRRLIDNNDIVIGKFSRLKQGDFVFCDTSEDLEGCGNFSYVMDDGEELLAGYHTIVGKPKEVMNYRFIAYYMMSRHWRTQIRKSVNGIKVYSISQQILKNSTIVLPEEGTQDKIVKYLDDKIMLIQNIIKSTEGKISHLNDLKKSLISEVVTGKIDVRDIEIPEYEKVNLINEEPDDIENEEE